MVKRERDQRSRPRPLGAADFFRVFCGMVGVAVLQRRELAAGDRADEVCSVAGVVDDLLERLLRVDRAAPGLLAAGDDEERHTVAGRVAPFDEHLLGHRDRLVVRPPLAGRGSCEDRRPVRVLGDERLRETLHDGDAGVELPTATLTHEPLAVQAVAGAVGQDELGGLDVPRVRQRMEFLADRVKRDHAVQDHLQVVDLDPVVHALDRRHHQRLQPPDRGRREPGGLFVQERRGEEVVGARHLAHHEGRVVHAAQLEGHVDHLVRDLPDLDRDRHLEEVDDLLGLPLARAVAQAIGLAEQQIGLGGRILREARGQAADSGVALALARVVHERADEARVNGAVALALAREEGRGGLLVGHLRDVLQSRSPCM